MRLRTPPWSPEQIHAALQRGPHPSALQHAQFVHEEMQDMVSKGFWTVLPYRSIQRLPCLRISPLGVVPQRERRPRIIVDYSFSGVNTDTIKNAPPEAMQFGRALARILEKIHTAPPQHGPVYLHKLDVADGFYQVRLEASGIPALGVALPPLPGGEPLVAFPLVLPMGWTESPPYFCCLTETVTDLANKALRAHWDPPRHPFELLSSTPPQLSPDSQQKVLVAPAPSPPHQTRSRAPATTAHRSRDQHRHVQEQLRMMLSQPTHRHRTNREPVAYVDVFVDDHIGIAQGSPSRLNRVRRTLLHAFDSVFRPNDHQDPRDRRDPMSQKKLLKGDGCWSTSKTILGWDIDTLQRTISLPDHRKARLHELLDMLRGRTRVGKRPWHQFLGELRSMALAVPGVQGCFSQLQAALQQDHPTKNRIRLHRAARDALDDIKILATSLTDRPTNITEVVPQAPIHVGATDASKAGMGGVWFPQDHPPIVWRNPWPPNIQTRLASEENPKGTITNSDLELAALVAHHHVLATTHNLTGTSLGALSDNTPTVHWAHKGSTTTRGPAAYLLRLQALHQRQHGYQSHPRYIAGSANQMADTASRRFDLSVSQLLALFAQQFPQTKPWQFRTLPPDLPLKLTSALLKRPPPPPSPPNAPGTKTASGTNFGHLLSAPWGTPTPFSPGSKTPSLSFKSLPSGSAPGPSASATNRSELTVWLTPSMRWQRRSPTWGPQTRA